MCLPNYRRGDGVFLTPSPDTEPPNTHTHTHTHTPDIPAEGERQGWLSVWGCMWLVIMGFSPRRASHRRISTRKQCWKTQTHTNIPSGCTQDHWQAVIETVSICVSLVEGHFVAMNECLMWMSHRQHGGPVRCDLKTLVWCVSLCINSLFLISPTSDRQTKPSDRHKRPPSHKARPNFSITRSEWSLNRSFL